jgi:anionic cell wall polymer biosynthesis LytR-Cps2A-Psr (LCP) family protein
VSTRSASSIPRTFGDAADPGIAATRAVVAETLGLGINYYAMVDMRGFENLIDALGGIRLDIAKAVPIGGGAAKVEGYIQPGTDVTSTGSRPCGSPARARVPATTSG